MTRTQCSGDCDGYDPVLHYGDVTLQVSQSGGALSGTINGYEITGTASGSSVTASGLLSVPPASCRHQFDTGMVCHLEIQMNGSADSLDRLRGTISYRVEGVDEADRPFSLTATGDLTGLVRWQ